MKVIGISGSLRKASCNTGLIRACQSVLQQRHGITLEIIPISSLPLFNQDEELSAPSTVAAFRNALSTADGFLLATCEYNGSVSAALKNAMDWGSRGSNIWNNKPVCIMGAGGYAGTTRAQSHLREIAAGVNLHTLTHPELKLEIFRSPKPFDMRTGDLACDVTSKKVEWTMDAFVQYMNMIKAAPLDHVKYHSS